MRALEILHRMDTLKQESEVLQRKNAELARYVSELEVLHGRVRELSIRDALTELYNRRYLLEQADGLFSHARRYAYPLSVAMLDLDNFKVINDAYGHQTGDEVLRHVAHILKSSLRETDAVARYGGEEFAVIMPNTNLESAVASRERLRYGVAEYAWNELRPALAVTVSIGVSTAAVGANKALFPPWAMSWAWEGKRF